MSEEIEIRSVDDVKLLLNIRGKLYRSFEEGGGTIHYDGYFREVALGLDPPIPLDIYATYEDCLMV